MSMDPERARRAKRWVWGCTGGCLGALVILGIIGYLIVSHLLQAMPIAPPQTFLTRDTSAFLFVRVDPEVPLTMETALDIAMSPEVAALIPVAPKDRGKLNRESMGVNITAIAPLQAVLALQPDEKGNVVRGLALSVRTGSRLLALVVKQVLEPGAWSPFKGGEIAQLDKDSFVALYANNCMASNREELLKTWVGNLEAELQRRQVEEQVHKPVAPPLNVSPALRRCYDRLNGSLPVAFASLNSHHELKSLTALVTDEDARRVIEATGIASDGVLSLAGEIKPLSARDGELTLFIECTDSEVAKDIRIALVAAATQLGDQWPLKKMAIAFQDDSRLVVAGTVADLPAKVANIVAAAIRHAEAAPKRPAPPIAPDVPKVET